MFFKLCSQPTNPTPEVFQETNAYRILRYSDVSREFVIEFTPPLPAADYIRHDNKEPEDIPVFMTDEDFKGLEPTTITITDGKATINWLERATQGLYTSSVGGGLTTLPARVHQHTPLNPMQLMLNQLAQNGVGNAAAAA